MSIDIINELYTNESSFDSKNDLITTLMITRKQEQNVNIKNMEKRQYKTKRM